MFKMGMQKEGESPGAFQKDGQFEDLVFYGAVREQWLSGRSGPPVPAG